MKEVPATLRIQDVTIGVVVDSSAVERETDAPVRSITDYASETFALRADMPKHQEREEFLEGVLTFTLYYYTAELQPPAPRLLAQLARGLVQTMRRNPEIASYIMNEVDPPMGFQGRLPEGK